MIGISRYHSSEYREEQHRFQSCAGEGRDADIWRNVPGFGLETG
jgi:hypothetical protein